MRRPWLLPLVPLYGAGLWVKRQWFQADSRRLAWPVVSVGSLSAGGAGKTPVVLALAELLAQAGYGVDVLSRGYGRVSREAARVDPQGTAVAFGDEPLLMARAGLSVWVGRDRFAAGCLAEGSMAGSAAEPKIHLLDDGLQHRRLARALDVVVLTAEDVDDRLLPAGNLREPLARLRMAGAVVLREEEAERLRPVVQRLAGNVPAWVIRRRISLEKVDGPVVAFCGIARPDGFFAMVRAAGVEVAGTRAFRDHHRFTRTDVESLMVKARRCGAEGFVTTEKDAVRLPAATRALLQSIGPIAVTRLTATFLDEPAVLAQLVEACG